LGSNDHFDHQQQLSSLGEGGIRVIVGRLFYGFLSNGSTPSHLQGESCNCNLTADDAVDFHIGIGFGAFPLSSQILSQLKHGADLRDMPKSVSTPLSQNSVIVEMTPHYRAQFYPGWTITKLQGASGSLIKVVGQMIVDNAHSNPKEDCGFSNSNVSTCWRMSVWEIHPVTQFLVCTNETSPDVCGHWVPLENL
jgi:hypothetical protein